MKRLMAAPCILMGLTFGLTALPSSAFAASGDSPSGYVGACNMLHDPTMAPGTGGAMDHDNANGTTGMWGAVFRSGC